MNWADAYGEPATSWAPSSPIGAAGPNQGFVAPAYSGSSAGMGQGGTAPAISIVGMLLLLVAARVLVELGAE